MGFNIHELSLEDDDDFIDRIKYTSLEDTRLLHSLMKKIFKVKLGINMPIPYCEV